jgi:hypothetical protein
MEGHHGTLPQQRVLNRAEGCIQKGARALLCDKRGCPVHDPRIKLASSNLPINRYCSAAASKPASPRAPASQANRTAGSSTKSWSHLLTKPARVIKLRKPAGVGKMRPPNAYQPRVKVEEVENDSSSILKPSKKITEPAVAVEVAVARSPSLPAPASPQPVEPIEKSAVLSGSASSASDELVTGSFTISTATTSPSSRLKRSPCATTRRSPPQYGDPGVAFPKGIIKRRSPPKSREPSFKQRVARFVKD